MFAAIVAGAKRPVVSRNDLMPSTFMLITYVGFEGEMTSAEQAFSSMVRKLRLLAPLGSEDEAALKSLPHRVSRVGWRSYLVLEGATPEECCLLIEGFACRSKLAIDGARQIVSFHVPGDILDLQHMLLERADHSVQAITAATVVWIPMVKLRDLCEERPIIGQALWRDTLIDASVFREWVLNVGRRDAKSRIAHMLCEFIVRCQAVGLGTPESITLPFTQEEIGDATGMTSVHVNRMLRELEEEGFIKRVGRSLAVQNWSRFQQLSGFDRAYLHAAA